MGAYAEEEASPLLPREAGRLFCKALPGIIGIGLGLAILVPVLHYMYVTTLDETRRPEYTVAAAGFSGLDPARDLVRPELYPVFNLTVRIRETREWERECIDRGTVAAVSYRGVALAVGPVPFLLCSERARMKEVASVMAWGSAVRVPEFARELLADDLRRGAAVVDVLLKDQATGWEEVECKVELGHGAASPPCKLLHRYKKSVPEPDARTTAGKLANNGRKLLS